MSNLHVQCSNGHWALTGNHADPDSALICPPGSGCCEEPHSHAAAAKACPGRHDDEPCPDKGACRVNPGGTCGGGHHGLGVKGCTFCRPITITGLAGTIGTLQPATGG